jgi:hypothetical protein
MRGGDNRAYRRVRIAIENMLELVFILPLIGIIYLIILPRDNTVKLKKAALE